MTTQLHRVQPTDPMFLTIARHESSFNSLILFCSDYIPIKAFEGRHFEFLGLFDCVEDVCARRHLPADRVSAVSVF